MENGILIVMNQGALNRYSFFESFYSLFGAIVLIGAVTIATLAISSIAFSYFTSSVKHTTTILNDSSIDKEESHNHFHSHSVISHSHSHIGSHHHNQSGH